MEDTFKFKKGEVIIGKWRLLDRIGGGGNSVVYRAVMVNALGIENAIALKLFNKTILKDSKEYIRFVEEIRFQKECSEKGFD